MSFKKITIIGVGLIGGSIGLAVKKNKLAKEVVGICRRKTSAQAAVKKNAVDSATLDYKEGLKNAELVIIATSVGKIVEIAREVIDTADHEFILTDVGSTKEEIVGNIENIVTPNIQFIGSHPMAGSEKSGVVYASEDLFDSSICIVTRTKKTKNNGLKKIKSFWEGLGASVRVLSPAEHDHHVSFVSHLPHVAAAAVAISAPPESLEFASTGFKDATRIASSDPDLWKDILLSNKEALKGSFDDYNAVFNDLIESICKGKSEKLFKLLAKAKKVRDSFN